MSNSPALDAAQMCITAAVLTAGSTWPAKVSRLTADPAAQAAFIDTPGRAPNPRWLLDYPAIQVLVRGNVDGYTDAYAKAKAIKDVLLGMEPVDIGNGDRWNGVTMLGDINSIGYDDLSRPMISMNFQVILEPAANALTSREPL